MVAMVTPPAWRVKHAHPPSMVIAVSPEAPKIATAE
jgi:hypothetical protein